MSMYLFVPSPCYFFWGLSLVLRSHDQFKASHWSTLLPYPPSPQKKLDLFFATSPFGGKQKVSVLLSAPVERFFVSGMRDFNSRFYIQPVLQHIPLKQKIYFIVRCFDPPVPSEPWPPWQPGASSGCSPGRCRSCACWSAGCSPPCPWYPARAPPSLYRSCVKQSEWG